MPHYVTLTEYNDNEGETWKFYIPATVSNLDALLLLKTWIEEEEMEEEYEIDDDTLLSEVEVNTLVRHGGSGYMNNFNKLSGRLVLPVELYEPANRREDLEEVLYKGGIKDFMEGGE